MSKTRVCSTVTSCIIMCIFVQVKSCFLNEWACVCVCVCVALSSEGVHVSESERPVKLFRLRKPLSR